MCFSHCVLLLMLILLALFLLWQRMQWRSIQGTFPNSEILQAVHSGNIYKSVPTYIYTGCIYPNVNIQICLLSFQFANWLKVYIYVFVENLFFLWSKWQQVSKAGKQPFSYLDVARGLSGILEHPRTGYWQGENWQLNQVCVADWSLMLRNLFEVMSCHGFEVLTWVLSLFHLGMRLFSVVLVNHNFFCRVGVLLKSITCWLESCSFSVLQKETERQWQLLW